MLKVFYTVLSKRKYLGIAIVSALVLLVLYIIALAPITPRIFTEIGMIQSVLYNSPFQLMLIILISILFGIWLSTQIYLKFEVKYNKSSSIITASSSIFSGFLGELGAIGGCPACIAIIASVIGSTATTFIYKFRTPILVLSILLILVSIYMTSKSIGDKCEWCK